MPPIPVMAILSFIGLPFIWRGIRSAVTWLTPTGLRNSRLPTLMIGESAYLGCNPFLPDTPIKGVIAQVNLGNPDRRNSQTIMTFRLNVVGKNPYPVSQARTSERGNSILDSGSGSSSTVPNNPYFGMPVAIPSGEAKVGWIGFLMIQRNDMTMEEAWVIDAQIVGILPDGKEISVKLPPCDIPRATEE